MASSKSPCAACKLQRRKCNPDCIFAPFFPANNPAKFNNVQIVYGLSNIQKMLRELPLQSREAAVNSLVFEANCRIYDKVYGCSGYIHTLSEYLEKCKSTLEEEKAKLANYIAQKAIEDYIAQRNVVGEYMPSISRSSSLFRLGISKYSNGKYEKNI